MESLNSGQMLCGAASGQGEFHDRASLYAHAQSRYPFVMEHQSNPQETLALLVTQSSPAATVSR
jgi:hypothetical protein